MYTLLILNALLATWIQLDVDPVWIAAAAPPPPHTRYGVQRPQPLSPLDRQARDDIITLYDSRILYAYGIGIKNRIESL